MSDAAITVMVVDDHPVMRAATRRFLEADDSIAVIAEAGSVAEVVAMPPLPVEVVVLDLSLPGESGLDGLPAIRRTHPGVKVLMLTMYDDPAIARRAFDAGVQGFLSKGCKPAELVDAVHIVASGHEYMASELSRASGSSGSAGSAAAGERSRLSARELEVLRLLLDGLRVSEIAERLGVNLKTASTFKARIHAKTGCMTLDQLLGYAAQHRLLPSSADAPPIDP